MRSPRCCRCTLMGTLRTSRSARAIGLSTSQVLHKLTSNGGGEDEEEETMNPRRFPYLIKCPECGRAIRVETAVMMGADYWQHLAKEHGMNRSIAVRHVRTD